MLIEPMEHSRRRRILYVQYANPGAYPPIQHSARILADAGWDVLFLGLQGGSTAGLTFLPHRRIRVRQIRDAKPGALQKLHYLRFVFWVVWTALIWRPSSVYASDALATPASLLLRLLGWRVVYHEHDMPVELNPGGPRQTAFMRAVLFTRRTLARRAMFCVLPNEHRAAEFKAKTGTTRVIYCVWNCPSRVEIIADIPRDDSAPLVVFFHGSIVPDRLPLAVVRAVANCAAPIQLRFAGYETMGHVGYVAQIRQEAERLGISHSIRYLGSLPRSELLCECAKADVGLSLMPLSSSDLNMVTMVGASNKPFDYLLCRLALLVSDTPEWREVFVEPGYGRICNPDDVSDIASNLKWFLDHPEETRRMGERGCEKIVSEWNYEAQFEPVRRALHTGDS